MPKLINKKLRSEIAKGKRLLEAEDNGMSPVIDVVEAGNAQCRCARLNSDLDAKAAPEPTGVSSTFCSVAKYLRSEISALNATATAAPTPKGR